MDSTDHSGDFCAQRCELKAQTECCPTDMSVQTPWPSGNSNSEWIGDIGRVWKHTVHIQREVDFGGIQCTVCKNHKKPEDKQPLQGKGTSSVCNCRHLRWNLNTIDICCVHVYKNWDHKLLDLLFLHFVFKYPSKKKNYVQRQTIPQLEIIWALLLKGFLFFLRTWEGG